MKAQDLFFQNINIMLEFNYSHRQTSHQRIWQRGVRVWPVIGTPLQRRAGSDCMYLNKQIPTTKMLIYMHVLVSLQTIYSHHKQVQVLSLDVSACALMPFRTKLDYH